MGSCILDDGDVLSTDSVLGSAEKGVCVSSDGTVRDIAGDDVVNAFLSVPDEVVSTGVLFSVIGDVNVKPEVVLSSPAGVGVRAPVPVTKSAVRNNVDEIDVLSEGVGAVASVMVEAVLTSCAGVVVASSVTDTKSSVRNDVAVETIV